MGNSVIAPTSNNNQNDIENNYINEKIKIIDDTYDSKYENEEKINNNIVNNIDKSIQNRTIDINKYIKGIIYKNKEEYGDFYWMINTGYYQDTLFIFDDNVDDYNTDIEGHGLLKIKKYNEFGTFEKISSAGIIMGNSFNNSFNKLDDKTKNIIDRSINDIKKLIIEYNFKEIYYLSDKDGLIKSSFYYPNKDIIKYVSEQLYLLNDVFENV